MGIRYRIERDKGYSLTRWDGLVTADDFLSHVRRMTADPDWPAPGRVHLTDIRFAQVDSSITSEVREQAVAIFGSFPSKVRGLKAAIVPGPEFNEAVEFERLITRHGANVIVFTFLPDACFWLGIAEDDIGESLSRLEAEPDS